MKLAIALILCLCVCSFAHNMLEDEFKGRYFHVTHRGASLSDMELKKMYSEYQVAFEKTNTDFAYRLEIFKNKVLDIAKHNQDTTKTWKKGINQFSDWTDEEFMDYYHLNEESVQNRTVP
jgi:hypothetical protein